MIAFYRSAIEKSKSDRKSGRVLDFPPDKIAFEEYCYRIIHEKKPLNNVNSFVRPFVAYFLWENKFLLALDHNANCQIWRIANNQKRHQWYSGILFLMLFPILICCLLFCFFSLVGCVYGCRKRRGACWIHSHQWIVNEHRKIIINNPSKLTEIAKSLDWIEWILELKRITLLFWWWLFSPVQFVPNGQNIPKPKEQVKVASRHTWFG